MTSGHTRAAWLWLESPMLELPPDTKFAAIHLSACSCRGLPDTLTLNNDLSAHNSPVMALDELDKSRIGADYAEAFAKSNLVLMASMLSPTAGVLDGESQELERRVYALFYALLMHGVPNFWPGVLTLGSRPATRDAWANRIAIINDIYRHHDAVPFRVTVDSLRDAAAVVPGILEVFGPNEEFQRLRRGINGLIRGWKAHSALDRLHAFVRALDGLMKLEQGERQFADRLATFATAARLHEIALEIYRLRSFDEHLSDWPLKLAYIKKGDQPRFVSHRSFQAEVLAGAAYRTLLADQALRCAFGNSSVDAFWQADGRSWTARVDLDAQDARFQYLGDN